MCGDSSAREQGRRDPAAGGARSVSRRAGALGLLLSLTLTGPASAQWTTQSPIPTDLDVRGIAAPSAGRIYVATDDDSFDDGGALFESTDGGATWVQRDVPENLGSPLNGLFFLDGNTGWAYGNGMYRTDDGGTTWTELPPLGSIYRVEFFTSTFGYANGGQTYTYLSYDAGDSWTQAPDSLYAFDFADATTGLGIAPAGIYRSTDGGVTFSPILGGDAWAIEFLSSSAAVAILDSAFVYSTDAGATWMNGPSSDTRSRLHAVSSSVVLASGRSGSFPDYDDRVLRSDDGGQTWTDLGEVMPEGVWDFAVVPGTSSVVGASRNGDMFVSTDAGATWSQTFASPGPAPSFLSSATPTFLDASTGYFGYGQGFVIATTDGGASWSQISSGTGVSLNAIDRFSDGTFVTVGDNGTWLTSDGTSPWVAGEAFTNVDLTAVEVIGVTDVVVTDAQGRIYRSADQGATWTAGAVTPPSLEAVDLDFTSLLDGWVIGSGFGTGALFHTTDGGDSWTAVTEFGGAYKAVDFEGSSGWAANVSGTYYRTTDDGATWTSSTLPGSPLQIQDMDFWDVATGYAVAWNGYAARSDDGGETWTVLPTPNSVDDFTDIHLLGPNELWISTSSDAAYYTANAGGNWAVLPIGSEGFGNFAGIHATPEGDAWTVGSQGYIEHFTGPPPPPLNQPPAASFDFSASGLSVDFTDTSSDPDGMIVSWAWEFGDSTFSSEQNPSHTYESADTYTVRLTVTDDDGDTGSTIRFVAVQPNPGGTFGNFTEVTPLDPLFVTPQNEDFWVVTTAPADYDGDQDLDIAVFGYYVVYNQSVEDRLVLLRNDGPAAADEWEFAYIDVPLDGLSAGASDLAWADVDGDGDQDLAVGSYGETVIYRNDAGTLVLTDTVLPGYYEDNDQADFDLRSMTWADYDNDGDQDLLLPSVYDFDTFSWKTPLMRNDGDNGSGGFLFTESDSVFAATQHAQSQWADYDGDEDLDLLLTNIAPLTSNGFIRRYRNEGNGTFTGEDILGTLTVEHGEVQWGDYDEDGDLDVLVAGNIGETDGTFTSAALRLYRNDAETYVPFEVIDCVPCEGWFDINAATWADYDTDGDIDILLAGTYNSGSQIEGRAQIYRNDGGVFVQTEGELPAPRASGTRGGTFSWLDLDGEGDLDYFIAGQYFVPGGNGLVEAQMHAYRNDAEGQNRAPTAPESLVADWDEATGDVAISWTAGSDDHTPPSALTYDLEVFLGGVPVTLPRRLPQPGNLSNATSWVLSGLPSGIYTYTLQTVDTAYNGSPVAQGEFNVGNVVAVETPVTPRAYAFKPNHPNPFNPVTTFSFELPEQTHVELTVFDPMGRLVTRLVSGTREAGAYDVRWEATGRASGVYFVRLSTPSFTKTRTVHLLK